MAFGKNGVTIETVRAGAYTEISQCYHLKGASWHPLGTTWKFLESSLVIFPLRFELFVGSLGVTPGSSGGTFWT